MIIMREIVVPLRIGISWSQAWAGDDRGLIHCWENGRVISESTVTEHAGLCMRVLAGELPPLIWKGGVDNEIGVLGGKQKRKFGTLQYLATWQGIKRNSLFIDPEAEVELVCKRTGITVIFTGNAKRWSSGSGAGLTADG